MPHTSLQVCTAISKVIFLKLDLMPHACKMFSDMPERATAIWEPLKIMKGTLTGSEPCWRMSTIVDQFAQQTAAAHDTY